MTGSSERLSFRFGWGLCALGLAACEITSVDAIVPQTDTPATRAECESGVESAAAGLFRLRSVATKKCLAEGASTTVLGTPARLTALVDDCVKDGGVWRLSVTSTPGSRTYYDVEAPSGGDVLDVEMAVTADGTPVIIYRSLGGTNQLFEFRARDSRVFEISPDHARESCISSGTTSTAIWHCDATAIDQEWQLLPADCEQ
jgi:hypothetical protein